MRAELKSLIGVGFDERVYWPDDEQCFSFGLEASIGLKGEDVSHTFQFHVCTPQWISTKGLNPVFGDFAMFGHGLLIVKDYDFEKIRKSIVDQCEKIEANEWPEIAEKLSRYGLWEYANY